MQTETINACRVCGLDQGEPIYGEDGQSPTYGICDCCGVEFGYEDTTAQGVRSFRNAWIASGYTWHRNGEKPDSWDHEKQFTNIPKEFR